MVTDEQWDALTAERDHLSACLKASSVANAALLNAVEERAAERDALREAAMEYFVALDDIAAASLRDDTDADEYDALDLALTQAETALRDIALTPTKDPA